MIKPKLYKGWELAKLLTEGKLKDGTEIQEYIDKELNEFVIYTIKDNCLWSNENYEVGNSILTDEYFEFEILGVKKDYNENYFINKPMPMTLDRDKLFIMETPTEEQIQELRKLMRDISENAIVRMQNEYNSCRNWRNGL